MKANWEEILKDRLELYGHRNWVVIADAAYPAQSKAGIETIVVDEEQTAVLDKVRTILRACEHVTAAVYKDKELTFVREEDAPGVTSYRKKLGDLVKDYEVHALPHETIIWKLDRVAQKFSVLLIKSNMRIPYTSVFFELGCGYWNAEAENRLRAAMRTRVRRTAANPTKRVNS
jgi:L-fucose mutarotase/ribose pyranase (RbsD/FucU family)